MHFIHTTDTILNVMLTSDRPILNVLHTTDTECYTHN